MLVYHFEWHLSPTSRPSHVIRCQYRNIDSIFDLNMNLKLFSWATTNESLTNIHIHKFPPWDMPDWNSCKRWGTVICGTESQSDLCVHNALRLLAIALDFSCSIKGQNSLFICLCSHCGISPNLTALALSNPCCGPDPLRAQTPASNR